MDSQLTLRLPGELADKLGRSAKRLKSVRTSCAWRWNNSWIPNPTSVRSNVFATSSVVLKAACLTWGNGTGEHLVRRLRRGE